MFSFGPALEAETAYQTERRRDARGDGSHGRDGDGATAPRRLLERSPLSDLIALLERRQRAEEARRASRVAVRTPSMRVR